jgi:hypothetical protein
MKRYYVGIKFKFVGYCVTFTSTTKPTKKTHPQYDAVVGPFRTKRGAEFMRQHGYNNPHCVTVAQAEKLAKLAQKLADQRNALIQAYLDAAQGSTKRLNARMSILLDTLTEDQLRHVCDVCAIEDES